MTSTTTIRHPVKAKSLTLLELCQTINELRHTSSRNTAQILNRRLYLHPLTISTNAKQHSSRIIANNLVEIEELNQTILEKKYFPSKPKPYRGLAILSSSFPLVTRSNTKLNHDFHTDYAASTTSISTNPKSLPPITRRRSSSLSKCTVSTRSTYIPLKPKTSSNQNNRWKKIDAWRHLSDSLNRPTPKDPPTTPLDIISDVHFQHNQEPNHNSLQLYQRQLISDSTINENDHNEEEENLF